jgi:hypothetical protein
MGALIAESKYRENLKNDKRGSNSAEGDIVLMADEMRCRRKTHKDTDNFLCHGMNPS